MARRLLPDGTRDDKRGSSDDRAVRKRWLLHKFGNGTTCACTHCGAELDYGTLTADRIEAGGSYARRNIQPSCLDCNVRRGDTPMKVWGAQCARS